MKNIIIEGHPTLRKIAKTVRTPLSRADKRLAKDLLDFIKNSQNEETRKTYNLKEAVGIAAPQVNISKKMFALHFNDFDGIEYSFVVINPELLSVSENVVYLPDGEGCLSVIRETEGITPRYEQIKVKFLKYFPDTDFIEEVVESLQNYPAIVFQHEFDHTQGVLFTDKISSVSKTGKSVLENYENLEDSTKV